MKKLVRVLVLLLLLLLVLGGVALLFINRLAAEAVERGGTYALGVGTTLDSARVHPLAGSFGLGGLTVANPPGFSSPHFFQLGEGELEVAMSSLAKDTIEAPRLVLTGLDMNLERASGKTNYGQILESLKRFESGPPDPEATGGKKFIVREVLINDVTVHVDLVPIGGSLTRTTVKLLPIHLTNIGTAEGAKSVAELTSELLTAVLNAVVQSAGGLIPADVLGDLKGSLGGLKGLALDLGKDVTATLEGVGKEIGEGAEKVLEQAGKGLEGLLKKL